MAFGDHRRVQNAIDYWGTTNQNNINNLRTNQTRQNQGLENRFNVAADRAEADYGRLSDQYGQQGNQINSYLNGPGISYTPSNQNFGAYGGYENFANTGGYSPEDISNIRARANAPIRATYANAQQDLSRRNVLAGGNLANIGASRARMARELSQNLGDQSQNTEAMIAEAVRSGRLAGLSGMTGIDTSRMNEGLANAGRNLDAQGMDASRIGQLLGLSGQNTRDQTSLYGTTPGQASMYGNQMLNSTGQSINIEQLQNQLMDAILRGTLGMSNVAGNTQSALGNIGSVLNLAGQVGGMFGGFGGGGGGGAGGGGLGGNAGGLF